MLTQMPRATGTRGQLRTAGPGRGKKTGGTKTEPPVSDAPTLAELGINKKRASIAKQLGDMTTQQRQKAVDELKEEGSVLGNAAAVLQAHPRLIKIGARVIEHIARIR